MYDPIYYTKELTDIQKIKGSIITKTKYTIKEIKTKEQTDYFKI